MSRLKHIFFLIFFFCVQLQAQEIPTSTITLKNGETYRGEIVLRTEEMVMLKTKDGIRYQFQTREIEKIGAENILKSEETANAKINRGSFAGMMDAAGGVAFANATPIGHMPTMNFTLAFGSRNAFGTNAFAGAGAGYVTVAGNESVKIQSFIPLFFQINMPLNNTKISPAIGSKAGYLFSLNDEYKGGAFLNLSGGIIYKLTSITSLYFGLYAEALGISGTVIENNELGEFTKQGNATVYSLGFKCSFLF